MTYQELATQVRQLPLRERLDLLNLLTLSLKNELAPPAHIPSSLERIRGIGKPDGEMPSDNELESESPL